MPVLRDSQDITPYFLRKGGVAWVTWPSNFWALNANCSNTVKGPDFKFDKHVPRDSPDIYDPLKFF